MNVHFARFGRNAASLRAPNGSALSYEQIAIEPGAKLNGLMICRNKDATDDFQKSAEIFQNNWNRITKE